MPCKCRWKAGESRDEIGRRNYDGIAANSGLVPAACAPAVEMERANRLWPCCGLLVSDATGSDQPIRMRSLAGAGAMWSAAGSCAALEPSNNPARVVVGTVAGRAAIKSRAGHISGRSPNKDTMRGDVLAAGNIAPQKQFEQRFTSHNSRGRRIRAICFSRIAPWQRREAAARARHATVSIAEAE
jgi:hypothetical protein